MIGAVSVGIPFSNNVTNDCESHRPSKRAASDWSSGRSLHGKYKCRGYVVSAG
jgi:hypothetical protein